MVDRHVIQARIAKIREYVALLRRIRGLTDEEHFLKDPLIYGNAERYLQLAIQNVLDISNHIVADMKLSLPAAPISSAPAMHSRSSRNAGSLRPRPFGRLPFAKRRFGPWLSQVAAIVNQLFALPE